eukprot:1274523-Rhodomonas_salina.1
MSSDKLPSPLQMQLEELSRLPGSVPCTMPSICHAMPVLDMGCFGTRQADEHDRRPPRHPNGQLRSFPTVLPGADKGAFATRTWSGRLHAEEEAIAVTNKTRNTPRGKGKSMESNARRRGMRQPQAQRARASRQLRRTRKRAMLDCVRLQSSARGLLWEIAAWEIWLRR